MAKRMTEEEIKTLVAMEQRQSLGYTSSKLAAARQKAEYYYLGLPIGDLSPPEIEGRSSVVSTDVRDTIEAMMPQLMVTFCGGDKVAEFEPQQPQDEPKANLATEYVNYLFFKKNNGHAISYTWMKDALLQKNGIVKVWWDTRFEQTKEEYKALNQVELAQIAEDPEVEITEQASYPDEDDAKQRRQAIAQLTQQLQQAQAAAQQGNAQALQASIQIQAQVDHIGQQPVAMLWDITAVRKKTDGKITVENVPPEEFLISRSAKSIQEARFVGHRVQRTLSELKSMGYANVDSLSQGDDENQANNMERIQRLSYNDENAYLSEELSLADESQRKIWVCEAYLRCDFDGDGISELRKVTVAGNELLDNEEVDFVPFVSICPVPLPHTFYGLSIADLALESQRTKTSILRSQLDNMYLTVNGRYFAVEGQVNLDDLLTSRPGGVVRMSAPGMAGALDQGRGEAGQAQALMEYMQQDLENRTGWSRMSMGNDAAGLHQTATSANIVTNKADMRVDLVARNFAEGYTDLFRYMLKLVCQHQNKATMTKIAGQWTPIDPREWRNQFDVTINVGIGLGNKDQKVAHMMALIAQQEKTFALGVTSPKNIYEASTELTKLLGFRNGDRFFTDPTQNPQPPKPDPEMVKAQGQMQIEQMKAQASAQAEQAKMQASAQVEQMKMQFQMQADAAAREHEAQLEAMRARMQAEVDNNRQASEAQQQALKIQHEAQLAALKAQYDDAAHQREQAMTWQIAQLEAATKIEVANIASQSKLQDAATKAAEADASAKL